jgi:transposase
MSREIRADYEQILLFPPSVEEWVGQDHPARFIRDFVDALDLRELGFPVRTTEVGRPNYASDLLLKVWLYGYFNSIRSSRKLEKACKENMGFIWLTGMNAPDHNSLWRFWTSNRAGLRAMFKKSVQVAAKAKLVDMVVHALDGTKIKSRSSSSKALDKDQLQTLLEKLDDLIEEAMNEVEKAESTESGEYGLPSEMRDAMARRKAIESALEELEETGLKKIHVNEPEARLMKHSKCAELSYNGQAVADEKSGIIVAEKLVNQENDTSMLVPMLDKVKENLGSVAQENLADGGYATSEQLDLASKRNYEVLTNPGNSERSSKGVQGKAYHTSKFTYDPERDCCICPHGSILTFRKERPKRAHQNAVRIYGCVDYKDCAHRFECSKARYGRVIEISVHHDALLKQREKRRSLAGRSLLKRRKVIIEPVFAWIKQGLNFTRWDFVGLGKAQVQWSMICTTINLRKLYRCWSTGGLEFERARYG